MPAFLKAIATGLVLVTVFACSEPDPAPTPPKAVRPLTSTTLTGTVGQPVEGGITVHVVDYSERSVEGAKVGFSIINGDGSVSSRLVVTDGDGNAHTEWTLGQTAGNNEVVASIFGVDSTPHFLATGTPAAATAISITPKVVRIPTTAGGGSLAGRLVDQYGNLLATNPTYTSRDPAIVTVNGSGSITATQTNPVNRSGSTYVVVTSGSFTDSAKVYTLSPTDPACTGITAMAALNVGDVQITGFADNGICIPASTGDREYGLIPFFDSPVPSAQTVFTVNADNVKATQFASLGSIRPRDLLSLSNTEAQAATNRAEFDRRLRISEQREMPSRAIGARQWYSSRSVATGRRATLAAAAPLVGDQMQFNVNDKDFCANPVMRTGHVVAVTNKAIVVADNANPTGFTDAEYTSLGATFDTLVYATDVTNFGAPTDIDTNGDRVILFFTHAVNELGQGFLGFAYSRDLLPKSGPLGSCPGSNVAEMLYIYVPDPNNSINDVKSNAVATMGHEFQHIINNGRRLYINPTAAPVEERWLNEGLSHIAEELLFYRSSNLAPRQNLGSQVSLVANQSAYINFQRQNFNRYFRFTRTPGTQGPIGVNDDDDDLETRGAIWSFLRFAADHRSAGNEAAFWQSLENSNSTGIQNLYDHVGTDVRLLVRDWAISNFIDDLVATDPEYTQPSWNLRQLPGFQPPITFNLLPQAQVTPTSASATVTLRSLSSEFVRFGVATNQEAYISATGFPANTNTPLPRSVLLAIVRTK
jgi:hypothetical protein